MRTLLTVIVVLGACFVCLMASGGEGIAAPAECEVHIKLSLSLAPDEAGKYVDATVLPNCAVVIGTPTVVNPAGGRPDSASTSCRFVNRMTGGGGEQDVLTELNTWQDFTYDGFYVWSRNAYNTTAVSSGTGWYVYSSPTLSTWGVPPVWRADATGAAGFGWAGQWHHNKTNETYVYGDSNCTANFYHDGYICGSPNPAEPCRVRTYIWRY